MQIGNWKLAKCISEGRWSRVYTAFSATQPSNQADYVIKFVDRNSTDSNFAKNMLIRELACSKLFSHPSLISFLDSDIDCETPYLVSPKIEGDAMSLVLKKFGKLVDLGEKLLVFRQLCDVIKLLHEHQIRHGDLSPDNIILNLKELKATITDLGLSEKVEPFLRTANYSAGTVGYIAPECLGGTDPITMSADVYSLGVIMTEFFGRLQTGVVSKYMQNASLKCRLQKLLDSMTQTHSLKRPTIGEVYDQVVMLEIQSLNSGRAAA